MPVPESPIPPRQHLARPARRPPVRDRAPALRRLLDDGPVTAGRGADRRLGARRQRGRPDRQRRRRRGRRAGPHGGVGAAQPQRVPRARPRGLGRRAGLAGRGPLRRRPRGARPAAPRPARRGHPAPADRGRRLRRLLRQRAPRDQRRAHLPARLRAAHAELEAPADRLPRAVRHGGRDRHRHRAAAGPAQGPDRPGADLRPQPQARHRGRAGVRRGWRHHPGRAGRRRGGRRAAPLRGRPAQRLERPRPAGLGVRAAGPVPRQVVRDLDQRLGHAAGGAGRSARRPPRPGPRAAPLPAGRARTRSSGWTCTSRWSGTAPSSPAPSTATCTGRPPRCWPTCPSTAPRSAAATCSAPGTISGAAKDTRGSFLELSWNGTEPVRLEDGTERTFLEDGDTVVLRAWATGTDGGRLELGEVSGTILPARQASAQA